MAVLKQKNATAVYMGWYGSCEQCDTFSLTHKDVREKILKVLQITDDNKSYTKFDGTIESEFDTSDGGLQDFTELQCGKGYLIILKSGESELVIPSFSESKISDNGIGKIIGMDECVFYEELPTPTPVPVDVIFEVSDDPVRIEIVRNSDGTHPASDDDAMKYTFTKQNVLQVSFFIGGFSSSVDTNWEYFDGTAWKTLYHTSWTTITNLSEIKFRLKSNRPVGTYDLDIHLHAGHGDPGQPAITYDLQLKATVTHNDVPNSPICLTGTTTVYGNLSSQVGTWSYRGKYNGHPYWRSPSHVSISGGINDYWYLIAKTKDPAPQWRLAKLTQTWESVGTISSFVFKIDSAAAVSSPELSGWGNGVGVIKAGVCGSEPVNCEGYWSEYNECDSECGGGLQTSSYVVTKEEQNGGTCENRGKIRTQSCNTESCKTERDDGKLFLKTYPNAYYPSAEFFGCAVNTYAGILRPGLKTKYARKNGRGAIGDVDGRHYNCQMKPRQLDFKGNIIALGNYRAENSTGAAMIWKLGTYKQTDCIGNTIYKTSGATNNLVQGMCDPINKSVRGDASSWMESSKMLTLNRNGGTIYIGAPGVMRADGTRNGTDTVGGYKDVPINTSNGISTQNSTTLSFHRFIGSTYNNTTLNIDDMATDNSGNLAISQPGRTKGDGRSFGAVLIGGSTVYSPVQANGYFGRASTGGRVLVGGNNFFAVSNSKLGKVYIITKAGGSWMIRTTLQRPPSDVNVTSFGNGLSATPVVKTSQYLAIEARTDTSSIIYVYRINAGGGYFFHSKIELSFKLSYGFCINSRSHPTFGLSVDVYVGNPYRKYRKSGASHDSTGSIDCYDGLTGELRTYTEVPEYGEVKVADDEKSSIAGLGRVLVCNGNYVASVSSSWVRQNHNGSTPGQVTVGNDVILVYDIKND